jgi:DNA-binding MarR family transcriptional regulator
MNEYNPIANDELLNYQTLSLQNLIGEMLQCCEDRKLYQSQRFELPYSELKCLMLFDGERYLTVKGIAQRLDVAKSRVTKIIDGLMNRGLVERMEDPNDGRIKLISLTSAGQEKSREIDAFQKDIHKKILLHLEGDERKTVLSNLGLLRSAMEAVKEQLT